MEAKTKCLEASNPELVSRYTTPMDQRNSNYIPIIMMVQLFITKLLVTKLSPKFSTNPSNLCRYTIQFFPKILDFVLTLSLWGLQGGNLQSRWLRSNQRTTIRLWTNCLLPKFISTSGGGLSSNFWRCRTNKIRYFRLALSCTRIDVERQGFNIFQQCLHTRPLSTSFAI